MSLRQIYTSYSQYNATGAYSSATGSFGSFTATGFTPVVVYNPNLTNDSVIYLSRATGTSSGLTGSAWVDSLNQFTGAGQGAHFTVRAQPGDVFGYRYAILNPYPL